MKYLSWTAILFAGLSTALHSPLQPTKLCSGLGDTIPHSVSQQASVVIQSSLLVDGISINGEPQALTSSIILDRSSGHTSTTIPMGPIPARPFAGISAAELPEEAFHALYTGMGGVMMNDSSMYAVPCMSEAELVFTFGGQNITIHPLYLTAVQSYESGNDQTFTVCTSSYQPATRCRDGGIILGDPFLHNVDAIYNHEDSVGTGLEGSIRTPSMRIIPLTDAKSASTEFKKTRAKILATLPAQVDPLTINDPIPKPLRGGSWNLRSEDTTQAQFSTGSPGTYLTVGSSSGSNSNNDTEAALKKLTTIAPIALTILILILALLVALIVISTRILALLKSQASPSAAAHVTTPLAGEVGDYRD